MNKISTREMSILERIVKYCNRIQGSIQRFGDDYNTFVEDFDFKNSISMSLLQIGELVGQHLSSEFKEEHKEIPWGQITGMRNHFAHGYDKMSDEEIWDTAKTDIDPLKSFCEQTLANAQFNQYDVYNTYDDEINDEIDIEDEL